MGLITAPEAMEVFLGVDSRCVFLDQRCLEGRCQVVTKLERVPVYLFFSSTR